MLYNNIIASQSGFYPAFNKPLTSGVSDAGTFTRASAQYVYDHEDVLSKAASNCVAITGSRLVTNLLTYSEDLSNAAWLKGGTCTVTGAQLLNLPAVNDSVSGHYAINPIGRTFRFTAELSGSGTVTLFVSNLAFSEYASITVTLTSTPTRYTISKAFTETSTYASVFIIRGSGDTATSVTVHNAQLENVTAQSNQNPGEYVKTTSAAVTKCFSTLNGNTVDANGVVTEETGAAILGIKGPLFEVASTNKVTAYGIIPADTLGSERIVNAADREFSSDTGFWTKEVGWAIGSGTLNATNTGTAKYVYRSAATVGKIYQITFTITSIAKGGVCAWFGGVAGTTRTTPGTYTETGGPLTNVNYGISSVGDTTASIDNVSIKEVQWAVGTKSYWTGSEFQQNITGLTLSGDTAAVLSIVTDETEILAAGLGDINPTYKVYKLDNSAGSGNAYAIVAGTVGNTSVHSGGSFVRQAGSGSNCTLGFTGNTTITSTTYSRVIQTTTPANSSVTLGHTAPPGRILYFLAPQLEEQPAATSVIVTEGATATRAATSLSYPTSGIFSFPLSGTFYWTPSGIKGSTEYLWGSYLDSNNSIGVFYDGTNVVFRKRVGGSNFDATKALTAVAGTTYKIGWRINADYSIDVAVDGTLGTGSADTTTPAATTTFKIGDDGNGTNGLLSSQIKDFKIYRKALPDTRL